MAILSLLLSGCAARQPQTLPTLLVGEWKTDDVRYRGRSIKIELDQITFGTGNASPQPDKPEQVVEVRTADEENYTRYTIRLKAADGAKDSVTLLFAAANGGALRFKNQPEITWRRNSLSSPAAVALPLAEQNSRTVTLRDGKILYIIDCLRPKVCGRD